MTILDEICASTRVQVQERMALVPEAQLAERVSASSEGRPFLESLSRPGMSVIAEFKRRSPTAGEIRPGAQVGEIARAYEDSGAAALSVLTESENFGGSLEDLAEARAASSLPVIRKDFVIDPYQVTEAAAAGADAILLIVAALDDRELTLLHARAEEMGLDVLVEVHDSDELDRALSAIDPDLIGINNRDLRDFSVDTARTESLMAEIPAGKTVVSESGIRSAEQVERLELSGVDAVLVGESLMRVPDPGAALRELLGEPPE